MGRRTAFVATAATLLAGCAAKQPMTPEEFRQVIPTAFMGKKEVSEVNRPFRAVADTFRKRAPECLNVSVKTTSQTTTSYQVIVADYKPTVAVTSERAEIHVQEKHKQGVMRVQEEPADGHYLVVVDAYPVDRTRTRIETFGPTGGPGQIIISAIKKWASGESTGCPDFRR